MKSIQKQKSGFALIEMVVALALFSVIILGVVSLVGNIFTASTRQSNLLSDEDQGRKVAFQIINELRNAQSGNDGSYSLNQAGDQQLIFFTGSTASTNVSRVRYYLSSGSLYRGVITPSGNPLGYTGAEVSNLVQRNVANGATPLFYYYDGNYNASTNNTPLVQPVNLTQVKFIKLNLMIYNKAGVTQTATYTITASGAIRNLKTNLGN